MRIIILGCGRMGGGLAQMLHLRDHAVTLVDRDPESFARLGITFSGQTIVGVVFDREVLLRAGIERADGLAAVTSSDDANIVAARLARLIFKVPRVVARLYDPGKADIYRRLGIQTISTTTWGINRVAELLCYAELEPVMSLGSDLDIVDLSIPPLLVGRSISMLTIPGEVQVIAISRAGKTFLPNPHTTLQSGDLAHLVVHTTAADRLRALLGN